MGELLRDGWMAKSSAGKQGLKVSKLKRDSWQRRYFVVTSTALCYANAEPKKRASVEEMLSSGAQPPG